MNIPQLPLKIAPSRWPVPTQNSIGIFPGSRKGKSWALGWSKVQKNMYQNVRPMVVKANEWSKFGRKYQFCRVNGQCFRHQLGK
jgi:hypothetical protein